MRRIVAISVALAVGALGVSAAAAGPASHAEAVRAVKEEIGSRWLLLETVPKSVRSRGASASVDCDGVSGEKFLCSWSARNTLRGQVAQGFAVVTPRPRGAEARLFSEVCIARDVQPCF